MRATSTYVVSAPIERVWSIIADHEGMQSWGPGMKVDLTQPGNPERNGVGAVRRLRTPLPKYAIVEEIVEFEPDRRLAYRALAGVPLKNYFGEIDLQSVAGGTRIDWSISGDSPVPGFAATSVKAISRTLLAILVRYIKRSSRAE